MSKLKSWLTPKRRLGIYIVYWIIYAAMFFLSERIFSHQEYTNISCAADYLIPFCEFFVVPYFLWFPYFIGMLIYGLAAEREIFDRMMRYYMVTLTIIILTYTFFPTCQTLRPDTFSRDNIFVYFVKLLYSMDTNTNILPSGHIIGSVGAALGAIYSKKFKPWFKVLMIVFGVLICASTVFLKQHSLVDWAASVPVCIAGYFAGFYIPKKKK